MSYKITLEFTSEGETPKYYLTEFEISVDMAIGILAGIVTQMPAPSDPIDEMEVHEVLPRPRKMPTKPKGRPSSGGSCEECGSKRRHRSTCSRAGQAPEREQVSAGQPVRPAPLSEEQFARLKETQEAGDMVSSEYAREEGLPLREVNLAIFADDYEDYLKERSKAK